MQRLPIVVGLLAASVAHADPESAVRANVDAVAHGTVDGVWGGFETIEVRPYTPRITVDEANHVAYFAADVTIVGQIAFGYSPVDKTRGNWPFRISGVLVDDHGWKVVGDEVSCEARDAELMANRFGLLDYRPIQPDPIAHEIAAWFPGKLLAHRASAALPAYVNGTAPGDTARDAKGLEKLVGSWDKLKLETRAITVKKLAGDRVWAEVTVTIAAGNAEYKELRVGVVAVQEGGAWRWVALNWNPRVDPDHAVR